MSDIKLFRLTPSGATELAGQSVALEVSLQRLIEQHLETLLGVRFLATEHVTGKATAGRIDTLGLDENGCPVIIEYKRALNENVINQGLFYLNWLMDHRGDFAMLVLNRLGAPAVAGIEWGSPRLLCIAGDFTKYDEHAVQQINRNIELIRYRRYGDDLLLFELVNASRAQTPVATGPSPAPDGGSKPAPGKGKAAAKTPLEYLAGSSSALQDLYHALEAFLLALGDDVQVTPLQCYIAAKRIKNFVCIEVHPASGKLLVYVKVNPDTIPPAPGFARDVRKIGHFGTGDLELTLKSPADLERAKPLIVQSYEAS